MASYSFYLLDRSGATQDYLVRACGTDQEALERAGQWLAEACGVEIWDGMRLVGQLAAPVEAAARAGRRTAAQWPSWQARHLPRVPADSNAALEPT